MTTLQMKRYDVNAIRLMRGPNIVGMLLRTCDNRWSVYDREEKRLTKKSFQQPGMARDEAERLIPQ